MHSHCPNDLHMKRAVQVLHHEQQQLTTRFLISSLLLNAQHTHGHGFAAECKAQLYLCYTCGMSLCTHMHWSSMTLAISDLYAHHRQLTLPAGQRPFLCLPSALTLSALRLWLCLMAPTSACGQRLHCRMPSACKLAPVHCVLPYERSALHASREGSQHAEHVTFR